jgi:serine phosphatase RsbU (regulator of sigma subunit)
LLSDLHDTWPGGRFAAVTALQVDMARHRFKIALAGQPDPLVRRADGEVHSLKSRRFGLVGALLDGDIRRLPCHPFPVGSWLVCVSDGVLDAGISYGEPFGAARLREAIRDAKSPLEAVENTRQRLFQHLGDQLLDDDVSVVVIWRDRLDVGCGASALLQAA